MVQEFRLLKEGRTRSSIEKVRDGSATVCVVGLGYVGYPLAEAFSHKLQVIGYDVNESRLSSLMASHSGQIKLTSDPSIIGDSDFILVCVPTPVTRSKEPDLRPILSAARTIGENLSRGAVVVLESTVYPGLTEEVMVPLIEETSGLQCGIDFKVGYSPERINPGDDMHELGGIVKIVAGMDDETSEALMELYGIITTPYLARNIRTAEAAKVIENIQRDLNIALMNELSIIFAKMGLDTTEVLEAAGTKWNFNKYTPGMVGGHCIPVDPYYLVYKARDLGYHPQVILAGRSINDHMPSHIAEMTIKGLNQAKKVISDSKVLIMGLTYKANVPDTRESPARELVKELLEYGISVYGWDPMLSDNELRTFLVEPYERGGPAVDCIIVTVPHDDFACLDLSALDGMFGERPVLIDIKGIYDGDKARQRGYIYRRL